MEHETTQIDMEIKETPAKSPLPDLLTIVQTHLNKITASLKENTVALVEMGITIKKLENTLEQLIKERTHG